MQEREKTEQTRPAVSHVSPHDIILNTAQMRDALNVQKFRIASPDLDEDSLIMESAIRESTGVPLTVSKTKPAAKPKATPRNAGQSRRVSHLQQSGPSSLPA